MSDKFKSPELYSIAPRNIEGLVREAFDLPEEEIEKTKAIAKLVGRDQTMKVEIGLPGKGSFFLEHENRIQIDPIYLLTEEDVDTTHFVSAHEGSHRAISKSPLTIGVPEEVAMELFGKLGFKNGSNMLEDPAVNTWWSTYHPGLKEAMDKFYTKQFASGEALGTPEVFEFMQTFGYTPRFATFGSELSRLWFEGKFSDNLPDDVREALERVKDAAYDFFKDIPEEYPSEKQVIEHARGRFQTYVTRIWPEIEALAKKDLADERVRKMIEEALEKKGGLKGKGGFNLPKDLLPEDLRKKIEDKIRQDVEEAIDMLEKELNKQSKNLRDKAKQKKKDSDDLMQKAGELPYHEQKKIIDKAEELEREGDEMEAQARELEKLIDKLIQQIRQKAKELEQEGKDGKEGTPGGPPPPGGQGGFPPPGGQGGTPGGPPPPEGAPGSLSRGGQPGGFPPREGLPPTSGGGGGSGQRTPLDRLPEHLKKELMEKMTQASEESAQNIEAEGKKRAEGLRKDAEKLRKGAKKLRENPPEDPKAKKEAGEMAKQMEADARKKEKEADQAEKDAKARAENIRDGLTDQPVPMDKLSEELRRELELELQKLSDEDKKRLEEEAKKSLEKLEDKLNKDTEGKLNEDKPENHTDRRNREESQAEKEREAELSDLKKAIERKLDQVKMERLKRSAELQLSPYQKAYSEVGRYVDLLAKSMEDFFRPSKRINWKKNFSSGGRVNVQRAMQFERDKSQYSKLWERREKPKKYEYKFTILVDLSLSMGGYKIRETFKGLIMIAEALSRVGIDVEILGFNNWVHEFKTFKEKMNKETKDKLSRIPNSTGGGTDTAGATNTAVERLSKQTGKFKFLITLTDGEPNDEDELIESISAASKVHDIKQIGIGLGPGMEMVHSLYPNSVVTEDFTKLARDLAGLLEEIVENPHKF